MHTRFCFRRRGHLVGVLFLALLGLASPVTAYATECVGPPAHCEPSRGPEAPDTIGIVYAAAQNHGLDGQREHRFVATAKAESRFNASARGDRGHSLGLFQLYDGCDVVGTGICDPRNGLLMAFYRMGYDDPFDPEQNADFAARIFASVSHYDLCRYWSGYRAQFC